MTAVWKTHPGPLPTLPGKVSGIVGIEPRDGHHSQLLTVQCAVCHGTCTDIMILAVDAINFRGDDGGDENLHVPILSYRRCDQCRTAGKHPTSDGGAA